MKFIYYDFIMVAPKKGYVPPAYQIYGVAQNGRRVKLQRLNLIYAGVESAARWRKHALAAEAQVRKLHSKLYDKGY